MSNRRTRSTPPKVRTCVHRSRFRTTPLALSNPFTNRDRRARFSESLVALSKTFPDASVDWLRRSAWSSARAVHVPRKRRAGAD